jgi:transmembrane sensor
LTDITHYTTEDFICDESFQRYCLGVEADVVAWQDVLNRHPEKKQVVEEAINIVTALQARQGSRQEQLQQLKESFSRYAQLKHRLHVKDPKKFFPKRYVAGIAASVLVAVVAYFLIYRSSPSPHSTGVVAASPLIFQSDSALRKTFVLADGSVVTLRKNSVLEVSKSFNQNNREVSLTGEAFFDVKKDAGHPFIVHTQEVDIKVVGTVFNVKAYPGNSETETALFRGRVEVSVKGQHAGTPVVLTPNQKLVINSAPLGVAQKDSAVARRPVVMPLSADTKDHKAKEIAWVRNRLAIENEPLEVIATKLQQWYGIEVVFEDESVKQYRYSGTFESETVVNALEALQLSYPFSFEVQKDRIIIKK